MMLGAATVSALHLLFNPASAEMPTGLEMLWQIEELPQPESVIPSTDGTFYYVSLVDGEGGEKDGQGGIALISKDGRLLDEDWAAGLDAPKGMALMGNSLFVSNIDEVVEIDTATGEVVGHTPIEGASFLNDVASWEGALYVSDSATATIHRIEDGAVSVFAQDDDVLSGVNGLHPLKDRLLVSTMSRGELLALSWQGQIDAVLGEGMPNADGIGVFDDGSYLVSSWPGQIHYVSAEGERSVLLETEAEGQTHNDTLLDGDMVVSPNWRPGGVTAYRIIR